MSDKVVYWFCVAAIFVSYVNASKFCRTPNNEYGSCVPISSCEALSHLVSDNVITQETHQYLESLVCAYWGLEPYVCCAKKIDSTSSSTTTTETISIEQIPIQQYETCITPSGSEGNCVILSTCKIYTDILKNTSVSNEATSYISRSRCGDGALKTCCPLRDEDVFEITSSSKTEVPTETVSVIKQQSNTCLTPNLVQGSCIFLSECEPLVNITNSPFIYDEDALFIKQSQCGVEGGKNKVCCPIRNEYTTTTEPFTIEKGTDKPIQQSKPCTTSNGLQVNCTFLNNCKLYDDSYLIDITCEEDLKSVCCSQENSLMEATPELGITQTSMSTEMVPTSPFLPAKGLCGKQNVSPRFSDRQRTYLDEYPWIALLGYDGDNRFHCGGVLISRRYVLTAAHCVTGLDVEMPYGNVDIIRLGEYNIEKGADCIDLPSNKMFCNEPPQDISVEEILVHPGWNRESHNLQNDIALIRLARESTIYANVGPICLTNQESSIEDGRNVTMAGWGIPGKRMINSTPFMLQTEIPIVNKNYCSQIYEGRILHEGQFCAERLNGTVDLCSGDSGGPLMFYSTEESAYVVVGVISAGSNRCGLPGSPMIYTNVPYYVPWIVSNMRA